MVIGACLSTEMECVVTTHTTAGIALVTIIITVFIAKL